MKKHPSHLLLAVLAGLASLLASSSARADNLYVANGTGGTISQFTPGGVGSVFVHGSNPKGLAFDTAGNLYVGNAGNNTIEKFSSGGVDLGTFASTGLSNPLGLAFDSAGNLYAANQGNDTIEKFTPGGIGSVFASSGLNGVQGLAFDSAGNLYAANFSGNSIEKFSPGGVGSVFASSIFTGSFKDPGGLAFDSAGNLYVTNRGGTTIEKFTPGGVPSQFANSPGLNDPIGLAFDKTGNLYVANRASDTIEKFTSTGTDLGAFASGAFLNGPLYIAFHTSQVAVRAAGFSTPIPGGTGNFTSLPGAPGFSSTGQAAFYGAGSAGQQGIYREQAGPPITVADLNTAIPNGTGNFTQFFANGPPIVPSISGNNVAFFGAGSGGQQGIYVGIPGNPIRIADTATPIPGGTGNFTAFTHTGIAPSPIISGDNVAFFGAGSGGQQGIYGANVAIAGPPIRIADTATPIPGGTGNFTGFPIDPALSGNNVAFLGTGSLGQQGIYREINGPPITVADLNTAIPGGTGHFTSFLAQGPPIAPAIDGTSVAFFGAGSGGQQGIYASITGPPIKIADMATAIPGGTGNFMGFGDVSLSATDIAFLGFGANGQQGIYDRIGSSLLKIVDLNDILDGRSITGLNFSHTGLFGDPLAFQATFADGSQGIYVFTAAVVPEPSSFVLLGLGMAAVWLVRGRRKSSCRRKLHS